VPSAAAAEADPGPICTDRPAKANAVCTVPAGTFQLETNTIGWSLTRAAGAQTKVLTVGSSFVKLGLTNRSDLESGLGDVVVRYKQRLTGEDAKVQAALIPFVKLPTAKSGIGNDKVEVGLAVPISFALAGPVTMTVGPELDLLADADGHGRHAALINLVNVAVPVMRRVTLAAELWSNFNLDPAGRVQQASLDGSVAYAISGDLQLDAGINIGLTPDTSDIELYSGLSARF
jgi:hypothetical protein